MKYFLVILITLVFLVPGFSVPKASAGNTPSKYKLDDSGRPLVNSWVRQENLRKQKAKKKKKKKTTSTKKTSKPTPSSSVTNR